MAFPHSALMAFVSERLDTTSGFPFLNLETGFYQRRQTSSRTSFCLAKTRKLDVVQRHPAGSAPSDLEAPKTP